MVSVSSKGKKGTGSKPENLPELISKMVNLKEEEDTHITQLATHKNTVLIAFLAPYVTVRVSPVEEARAFIGLHDEFGIEELLRKLGKIGIKNAYLLVNSSGGALHSAYKIARAIRSEFKNITTFVPHVAASGGTLLALVGNKIVMGPMSHLTPLDVQVNYKGGTISTNAFMKFFSRASSWFEKVAPEEAPYPRKALADKLDPLIMEEWSGLTDTAMSYILDILKLADYGEKGEEVAQNLALTFPSHGYVINYERASEIGLNVENANKYKEIWDIMRYWLSKYMFEKEMTHCIRYALPADVDKDEDNAKKEKKNETKK